MWDENARAPITRLREGLYVGPMPETHEDVETLLQANVGVVFDLMYEEQDICREERLLFGYPHIIHMNHGFPDGTRLKPSTLHQILSHLTWIIDNVSHYQRHAVFVHCRAGMSRSPFLCAAYIASSENRELYDVIGEVERLHPPTKIYDGFRGDYQRMLRYRAANKDRINKGLI